MKTRDLTKLQADELPAVFQPLGLLGAICRGVAQPERCYLCLSPVYTTRGVDTNRQTEAAAPLESLVPGRQQ